MQQEGEAVRHRPAVRAEAEGTRQLGAGEFKEVSRVFCPSHTVRIQGGCRDTEGAKGEVDNHVQRPNGELFAAESRSDAAFISICVRVCVRACMQVSGAGALSEDES